MVETRLDIPHFSGLTTRATRLLNCSRKIAQCRRNPRKKTAEGVTYLHERLIANNSSDECQHPPSVFRHRDCAGDRAGGGIVRRGTSLGKRQLPSRSCTRCAPIGRAPGTVRLGIRIKPTPPDRSRDGHHLGQSRPHLDGRRVRPRHLSPGPARGAPLRPRITEAGKRLPGVAEDEEDTYLSAIADVMK